MRDKQNYYTRARLVYGPGRGRVFEWVADSTSLEMLADQLKALDPTELGRRPVLVLLNAPDEFEIFSAVRATR